MGDHCKYTPEQMLAIHKTTITHLKLIIADQTEIINTQRNRIAEFEYSLHRYGTADKEPLRFIAWTLLKNVWPFKFLWRQQ
jgi:hypothetical protein